jgi:hypothetical protein
MHVMDEFGGRLRCHFKCKAASAAVMITCRVFMITYSMGERRTFVKTLLKTILFITIQNALVTVSFY